MNDDYDAITALCQQLGKAHYYKNSKAIMECYSSDAVVYSLAPPLRNDMTEEGTAAWLATWDGPIHVDAADMNLVVSADLAYSTALNRMRGTKVDGKIEDIWFRSTICFRKTDGEWKIVHDHSSTPFYMDGSLRAAVDLKPAQVAD